MGKPHYDQMTEVDMTLETRSVIQRLNPESLNW